MNNHITSRFTERPKFKTTWRAMWLGLATILTGPILGIFAAVVRPIIGQISSNDFDPFGMAIGFGLAAVMLILTVFALVNGIRALRQGERSWVLWIGFVPAILVGIFWIVMLVGEFMSPH